MEVPHESSSPKTAAWTYVEMIVQDGDRAIKPTHVCGDELTFAVPPGIVSPEIKIFIKNGDRQTTHIARVLPHESDSKRIPIQLINTEQKAPAKLTA